MCWGPALHVTVSHKVTIEQQDGGLTIERIVFFDLTKIMTQNIELKIFLQTTRVGGNL